MPNFNYCSSVSSLTATVSRKVNIQDTWLVKKSHYVPPLKNSSITFHQWFYRSQWLHRDCLLINNRCLRKWYTSRATKNLRRRELVFHSKWPWTLYLSLSSLLYSMILLYPSHDPVVNQEERSTLEECLFTLAPAAVYLALCCLGLNPILIWMLFKHHFQIWESGGQLWPVSRKKEAQFFLLVQFGKVVSWMV